MALSRTRGEWASLPASDADPEGYGVRVPRGPRGTVTALPGNRGDSVRASGGPRGAVSGGLKQAVPAFPGTEGSSVCSPRRPRGTVSGEPRGAVPALPGDRGGRCLLSQGTEGRCLFSRGTEGGQRPRSQDHTSFGRDPHFLANNLVGAHRSPEPIPTWGLSMPGGGRTLRLSNKRGDGVLPVGDRGCREALGTPCLPST